MEKEKVNVNSSMLALVQIEIVRCHRDRRPAIEGEIVQGLVERAPVASEAERGFFRGAERAEQRDIPAERLPHATDRESERIGAEDDQALDRFVELADRSAVAGQLDGYAASHLSIAGPQGRYALRSERAQIRDCAVVRLDQPHAVR